MLEWLVFNPWFAAIVGALLGWKLRLIPLAVISVPVALLGAYHVFFPLQELAALLSWAVTFACVAFLVPMWLVALGVAAYQAHRSDSPAYKSLKETLFR